MNPDIQQAIARLHAEREREQDIHVVNLHTGTQELEDVWALLDYVDQLEAIQAAAIALCEAAYGDSDYANMDTTRSRQMLRELNEIIKGK